MTDFIWSIIIPVRDRSDWLSLSLTGIKNFTKHTYEIILVDGCSEEKETHVLYKRAETGEFGPCKVIYLAENRSFSNAINSGCRASSGRNFIWLNSDAIPTDNWDKYLYQDIQDKKVGMVGCRSNAAAGVQGTGDTLFDPKYLVFFAVALRKEVYEQVGPMPEDLYTGWSSEDLSYSWRIRKAGGKLKLSLAYVLHGCSRTLEKTVGGAEQREKNNEKYGAVLVEEWGREWVEQNTSLKPKVMIFSFSPGHTTSVAYLQQIVGLKRGTTFEIDYAHYSRSGPIQYTRQAAAESILSINKACKEKNDQPYDWVCFIDDDQVEVPHDALIQLMRHNKDVVGTIAYQRGAPFNPCVFNLSDDGVHVTPIDGLEHTGLRKVDAIGFPMVLIKVSVFERLREFYVNKHAEEKGLLPLRDRAELEQQDLLDLQKEREKGKKLFEWLDAMKFLMEKDRGRKYFDWGITGEDLFFCARCRQAGISIHVDSNVILGHLGAPQIINEKTRKDYLARTGR